MWYDGTQHPWEFKRVWHIEPSLTDPDAVYAGIEDAALFHSTNGGQSWHELSGLRGHVTGPNWQPGAGGMCLHTVILDPTNPDRIYIAISAAGAFRTDDGGKTWKPGESRAKFTVPPCRIRLRKLGIACIALPCTQPTECSGLDAAVFMCYLVQLRIAIQKAFLRTPQARQTGPRWRRLQPRPDKPGTLRY